MNASKIVNIISYVLMGIGVIFLVLIIYHGDLEIETSPELQSTLVDPFINIGWYATIITAIIAVAYSIYNLLKVPKNAIKALIGLGFLAVVLLISYLFANGGDYEMYSTGEISVSEETSKLVGMGLNALYIVMTCTILSIIYVEASRAFKR